jgi:hypothetical protein
MGPAFWRSWAGGYVVFEALDPQQLRGCLAGLLPVLSSYTGCYEYSAGDGQMPETRTREVRCCDSTGEERGGGRGQRQRLKLLARPGADRAN